jgi:hypothetical protein
MKRDNFNLEIFLVALAGILLEVSYTRIFSFKLFYYFTYLTIGIALLGIGTGGVVVSVSHGLRRKDPGLVVAVSCVLAAVSVPFGYFAIAVTQLNALDVTEQIGEALKLVLLCGLLFIPFFLVGTVISTIFADRPTAVNRLYFADLVGAGLGCAIAIPLFDTVSPPGAIILSGVILAVAGLRLASRHSRVLLASGLACAFLASPFVGRPDLLPDPVPDRAKTMSPQRRGTSLEGSGEMVFSRWSSVFRIDKS